MVDKGKIALILAAVISIVTAISHLSCIFIGPVCFEAQMAPHEIVKSAINGTMLAPIATLIVSGLFISCGICSLSGAGIIKKLPYINFLLVLISALCIFRGISTVPLSFLFPEMVSAFSILAGSIWFFTGLLFAYGYLSIRHKNF